MINSQLIEVVIVAMAGLTVSALSSAFAINQKHALLADGVVAAAGPAAFLAAAGAATCCDKNSME